MKEATIIISENQKAFYIRFFAALSYTIGMWYLFFFIIQITNYFGLTRVEITPLVLNCSDYLLVPVLGFIGYMTIKIKVEKVAFNNSFTQYRKISSYGRITFKDNWKDLPKLDYVSIYYDGGEGDFEMHLWSFDHTRIKLFESDNWAELFYLTFLVASKLNIRMFNSINRKNGYWVDLTTPVMDQIDALELKYKRL